MGGVHRAPALSAPEMEARRAEREETRQLIREMHEAVKDARAVLKELRAERDAARADAARLAETARAALEETLKAQFGQVTKSMSNALDELAAELSEFEALMQRAVTAALGAQSPEELMTVIMRQVITAIAADFSTMAKTAPRDRPPVIVTTSALDGRPPGVYISDAGS
jgi:chromosome segregation ATPase